MPALAALLAAITITATVYHTTSPADSSPQPEAAYWGTDPTATSPQPTTVTQLK